MSTNVPQFVCDFFSKLRHDKRGSMAIEGAFLLPVFVLLLMGSLVSFHALRVDWSYTHAATALSDIATRQTVINEDTLESFYTTADAIALDDTNLKVSFTSVSYDEDNENYFVNWSCANVSGARQTTSDIQDIRFPRMQSGDSVMMVLVEGAITPIMDIGLSEIVNLSKLSIRRPRFVAQIPDPDCV